MEKSFILYEDEHVRINYEILGKGLKIKLYSEDAGAVFDIRGLKGKSLVLTWEQFGQAKISFEECTVSRSKGEPFELSIPLPISYLM